MSGSAFQIYKKHGNVSRGYTGDTGRLTDGHRSVGFQLLACLNAEASYIFVINVFRKLFLLQFLKLLYLLHLAADVAIIFDVDLYLLTYIFRKLRSFFIDGCKHLIVKLRPTDQLCNGGSGFQKGTVQRFQKALYLCRTTYGCMFHSLDLFLDPALFFL